MILRVSSLSVNAASISIFMRNSAHIFLYTQMCFLGTVQCGIFRFMVLLSLDLARSKPKVRKTVASSAAPAPIAPSAEPSSKKAKKETKETKESAQKEPKEPLKQMPHWVDVGEHVLFSGYSQAIRKVNRFWRFKSQVRGWTWLNLWAPTGTATSVMSWWWGMAVPAGAAHALTDWVSNKTDIRTFGHSDS